MRQFKTAIVIAMLSLTIGLLNSCNDTSKKEETSKDSTTNTMSGSSKMSTDTLPVTGDTSRSSIDTGSHKGDQTPPVH